ncbi:SOSS complex subunit C homolog isoform X2 [Anabrus simplex]|uniref:SOSS complex subunit C homolog isoform X2 n=1 Tax=Anabrus simplex TaxID=316456 RepID=UPI0034DCE296
MVTTFLGELANRKILEELQLKKQLLLKQGVQTTLSTPNITTPVLGPGSGAAAMIPEGYVISSSQRAALQHANSQSFGYFVPQDSSFGNLILPVLPRYESK